MDTAAENLFDSFKMLPEPEKLKFLDQVLRWARDADYAELSEETLTHAGASLFLSYDAEESPDA